MIEFEKRHKVFRNKNIGIIPSPSFYKATIILKHLVNEISICNNMIRHLRGQNYRNSMVEDDCSSLNYFLRKSIAPKLQCRLIRYTWGQMAAIFIVGRKEKGNNYSSLNVSSLRNLRKKGGIQYLVKGRCLEYRSKKT